MLCDPRYLAFEQLWPYFSNRAIGTNINFSPPKNENVVISLIFTNNRAITLSPIAYLALLLIVHRPQSRHRPVKPVSHLHFFFFLMGRDVILQNYQSFY